MVTPQYWSWKCLCAPTTSERWHQALPACALPRHSRQHTAINISVTHPARSRLSLHTKGLADHPDLHSSLEHILHHLLCAVDFCNLRAICLSCRPSFLTPSASPLRMPVFDSPQTRPYASRGTPTTFHAVPSPGRSDKKVELTAARALPMNAARAQPGQPAIL